jgi:protein-S-isoprenylcysteine O-methyltransferase Ste14
VGSIQVDNRIGDEKPADRTPESGRVGLWDQGAAWALGQLVLLVLILFAPAQIDGLPVWPESLRSISIVAGLLAGAAGSLLLFFSGAQLGSNLTIFPRPKADGSLTQSGAYRFVRHPMYGSVLLLALGWALLRASLPALILTLALGLFFDRKSRREEAWLVEKYPDYGAYRKRVRKLIPWLY